MKQRLGESVIMVCVAPSSPHHDPTPIITPISQSASHVAMACVRLVAKSGYDEMSFISDVSLPVLPFVTDMSLGAQHVGGALSLVSRWLLSVDHCDVHIPVPPT